MQSDKAIGFGEAPPTGKCIMEFLEQALRDVNFGQGNKTAEQAIDL